MKIRLFGKIHRYTALLTTFILLLSLAHVSCGSEEDAGSQEGSSEGRVKADLPEISALLPSGSEIPGYEASGNATVYTRQDIWDHLSQKAEIYLSNQFTAMAVETYRGDRDDSIVVEISQFGDSRSAFGLFAELRDDHDKLAELDPPGYFSDNSLSYVKGQYYLRVNGTDRTGEGQLLAAAEAVVPQLSGEPYVHPHAQYLPGEGMIPNSMKVSIQDGRQHNEQPDFVSALFAIDSDTMRVYYQHHSRLGMTFAVEEFLDEGGKVEEYLMGAEFQSLVGESQKHGSVYCAVDRNSVCAVTGFSDRNRAKAMVERVFKDKQAQ
jgi:hypothetical protein